MIQKIKLWQIIKLKKERDGHDYRLREISDSINCNNICIIVVPEEEEWEKGTEGLFKQIIADNFLNLGKKTGFQVQGAQRTLLKINKNRSTPTHIIVKPAKYKHKERFLKAARDKRSLTYKGRHISLAADLSTEPWKARREWHDIFKMLNGKNMQPRIFYPARISFRIQEIEFPRQAKTKGVCEHQTSSARIIKGWFRE